MKAKRLIRYGILLVAVLIVFVVIAQRHGWVGSAEGIPAVTDEAAFRDIVEIVTANGRIQPVTQVKISPDVSGEVIDLRIKEGDYVRRGDLLVRINPDVYESMLDRAIATLNTNKANLASSRSRKVQAEAQFVNAESSYLRQKRLFEEEAISRSEYDAVRSQYLTAQAEVEAAEQAVIAAGYQVKSAEAAVREARDNLTKTNIFSPMDGTISRLDTEIGERVVGTSQFAGTEIMRIANLSVMEVLVEVNENDIVRVSEGDTAIVDVDAYFGEEFLGVVTAIANSAKFEAQAMDQVTNFEVRIRILPQSYEHLLYEDKKYASPFRPGMSATVDIQTQKATDALSVPIQAVTIRDIAPEKKDTLEGEDAKAAHTGIRGRQQQSEVVFLFDDGIAKMIPVKTGIQDLNHIEIKQGIEEGDKVITGPYRLVSTTLKDGDRVRKTQRHALFADH